MKLFAFSGIGKHEAFVVQLQNSGFATAGAMRFPDHHLFTERDKEMLGIYAKALAADGFITTEKDVARLRSVSALLQQLDAELPVFYLVIDVEILGGKEILHHCIEQTFRGVHQ
jgi:tetraacyldisaccharide 4'-kinase